MNRRRILQGGAIATAAWVSGQGAGAAPAPKILRYSDHEPLGGMRTRFLKDVLFPAIERESQGRLKIDDHWNGEIAIAYDALAAVSEQGTTDLATVVPEYFADRMPVHQLFKSFPVGPTGAEQLEFFRRVYARAPEFSAEMRKNNTVELFFGTGFPVAFFSREPLNTLQDLRGGKWRSASFWHQDFLRNAGATPVSMHWGPEIYDAIKARTLDGLMVNVDSGYMLKVHEAAPQVLVSKDLWLGHLYLLAMNRTSWDALAQEDQDAIRRAASFAYQSLGAVMARSLDVQIEQLKEKGATVRMLRPAEVEQWARGTQYRQVQDAWVKAQQAKGVQNLGGALETCRTVMGEIRSR